MASEDSECHYPSKIQGGIKKMIMMMMTNDMMQFVKRQGKMMVVNSIEMNMPHRIILGQLSKHCN